MTYPLLYAVIGALIGVWRICAFRHYLNCKYPLASRGTLFEASDCWVVVLWMLGWPWLLPFDLIKSALEWRALKRKWRDWRGE